jgi:CRP/FNR family transcriptional regulator, cyclic AMP receptor protein
MARRSEHVDHLKGIELFANLSKSDLGRIAAASSEQAVPAGTTIVHQGDAGREAYVILEGSCVVRRGNRKVATITAGDVFGELSLLDLGPRTAYVESETFCRLLVIPAKEFGRILEDVPKLSRKLLATLATRVRDLDRKAFG